MKRNLLDLSLRKIECRIGEIKSTVRPEYDIIGAIKTLAVIAIGENLVLSMPVDLNNCAKQTRTIDQTMLRVVSISVGIA